MNEVSSKIASDSECIFFYIAGVSFSSAFFSSDGYLRFPLGTIPIDRY